VDIVDIGPADRALLEDFSCAPWPRRSWSVEVESMIRRLADELASPYNTAEAIGATESGRLCGVAAYIPIHPDWQCCLLAVRRGRYRETIGTQLKQEVLARARLVGAESVVSFVHEHNDPMINLNVKLGAKIRRLPERPEYFVCTIPL
jgi:RimJ/RimL family protein N-acetyltransferase